MKNTLKTTFCTLLVLSIAVPLTSDAQGYTNKTYDPIVVDYLDEVLYKDITTSQRTIDGDIIIVKTISAKTSNDTYELVSHATINGSDLHYHTFSVTVTDDDSYRLVNDDLDIDKVFTDEKPNLTKRGTGNSDTAGARISLYDKEHGTPGNLTLTDSYSGCGLSPTNGKFIAYVRPHLIDVNWNASVLYSHLCLVPHLYDHVEVQYGTDRQIFDNGQKTRKSSYAFTNYDVGTPWYSVSVSLVYGSW